MNEPGVTRVAVYIDFDNIVISRYDQVHGRGQFQRDRARLNKADRSASTEVAEKLERATVDIGAVIDFASSFGTLVLTRAYADWSTPVNADYQGQLVSRAVDLVQLFPTAAYAKNGADIRLAVDAVEDMFRLPDLTHIVIVAGDSDYIALAQRCRRLGRYVVGVGVAGSTSRALAAACDELVTYDALPGITPADASGPAGRANGTQPEPEEPGTVSPAPGSRRRRRPAATLTDEPDLDAEDPQEEATRLLERALQLGQEKEDTGWLHSSAVKSQMRRMDPSFSERALGFRSFSDFVKSREEVAELDESDPVRLVRLNPKLTGSYAGLGRHQTPVIACVWAAVRTARPTDDGGKQQMAGNFSAALQRSDQSDITVTGRKTGRQITIPVWFVADGGKLDLVPVRGSDSDWYKNLLATPRIQVTADGESITATPTPITDPDRVRTIVEKFRQKYGADQVAAYYPKTDVALEVNLPQEAG